MRPDPLARWPHRVGGVEDRRIRRQAARHGDAGVRTLRTLAPAAKPVTRALTMRRRPVAAAPCHGRTEAESASPQSVTLANLGVEIGALSSAVFVVSISKPLGSAVRGVTCLPKATGPCRVPVVGVEHVVATVVSDNVVHIDGAAEPSKQVVERVEHHDVEIVVSLPTRPT